MTDREAAYDHWSRLHGGLDPRASAWVSGWVRLTHACARPLARAGASPHLVTAAGVALTAAVPAISDRGAAWPLLATPVLVVAAVLDGVDGALAAQTGRDSAWGRVVDGLADRCSDLLLVLTLVVLGAPVWLGVLLGVVTLLLESARATAEAAGLDGPGAVTVWERPSRVIVPAFATTLVAAEWWARRAGLDVLPGVDGAVIATASGAIGLALATFAALHLLVGVRRGLQAVPTRSATIRAESSTSGSPPPGWAEPPTR
ncbi:CDP-alcohol phosphatidyltransferase family protein [Nocardioides sp. SYSU D00038]|uniref:CDP-alcohol phosphatidyltransferase family protein n=1 Tax=Nocardioides sp. SYSU D00038 TaxID=2812554 RepID=UPI001966E628|nr:CDP-alcohol phosphatidyltransferase family protein [Nocardioides sp. SYSU D00038]